ncbi:carboxypeptidase C [Brettanomyces nanus]|uniref:Carboxypeptidase n=1 Tax=Eeniella nana TaxID=13502 RepID=A0A875RQC6_EENNA|nr:carboxypeptidase C [Brettanomyces nanus]QPG76520.1 carboxypeptidase C [Brettanomyces nanus]
MKLTSTALLSLLVASSTVASVIGDLGLGLGLDQQQRPIQLDSTWNTLKDALQKGSGKSSSLLEKVAELTGESFDKLDSKIKETWDEMEMLYPNTLSQLQWKSQPKFKINKKPESFWDFHVTNTDKLADYQLRVKKTDPKALGVDTTKQYSGYLDDVQEDKHWFYWFFESRNDPKNDPVILWLNGGPGCSSLTGLFFELGPSSIGKKLKPIYNPYSWNSNASVIFLDQPVNVGYSYSSQSVSNTVAAGKDVYAFLELFFQQFPEYLNLPFHMAAESYGGHYIPSFASEILSHPDRSFNLTSVMIGNGLTDPLNQYPEYETMACTYENGYKPVLDETSCQSMSDSLPRCLSMIESCYNSESIFSCVPASIYCNNGQLGPYQKTGRNVYDVRKMCEGNDLCYEGLDYIGEYLNQDYVKEKLGAEVDRYESCNMDINRNFLFAGDWMKPFHKDVLTILQNRVPVLIYAGDKDFICNWLGNQAWSTLLPWEGHKEFQVAEMKNITIGKKNIGEARNYDIFTFARMFDGGHMVPYDQPVSSLTMLNRWISGDYNLLESKE